MKKLTLFILLCAVSLYAQEATSDQLNGIYTEALLFIGIFGTMGIISYVYSSRHAKVYAPSQEVLQRIEREKAQKLLREARVEELSEMLQNDMLTNEEFLILKDYYKE